MKEEDQKLFNCLTRLVASYLKNNAVEVSQVPSLIASVHAALKNLGETRKTSLKPAVDRRRSVQPNHIVCLEDGKRFKSLRRHIAMHHGMTPDEYRSKWNLPRDYPMVPPNYADEMW